MTEAGELLITLQSEINIIVVNLPGRIIPWCTKTCF